MTLTNRPKMMQKSMVTIFTLLFLSPRDTNFSDTHSINIHLEIQSFDLFKYIQVNRRNQLARLVDWAQLQFCLFFRGPFLRICLLKYLPTLHKKLNSNSIVLVYLNPSIVFGWFSSSFYLATSLFFLYFLSFCNKATQIYISAVQKKFTKNNL